MARKRKTTVVNVREAKPGTYTYVGRKMRTGIGSVGSPWGNPFRVGPDGDIGEVLDKFRARVLSTPSLVAMLPGLKGQALGCWCCTGDADTPDPQVCHGQVLAGLADDLPPLRCLSVRQPHASAILSGLKVEEWRTWEPTCQGVIIIHAGKTLDRHALEDYPELAPERLVRGAILGAVVVGEFEWDEEQPEFCRWTLTDPLEFATPIQCLGQLGLYPLRSTLDKRVRKALLDACTS